MPIACAEPWSYEVLSAGWKEVSLRLSKPWPNSISGVEQLPKSAPPVLAELLEEDAADEADEAAVAVAEESAEEAEASEESDDEDESEAEVDAEASADELADAEPLEPVPAETTLPWLSITSWEAKS